MATIRTQLQIKRNTSNSNSAKDEILKKGEPFFNSPTEDFYVGDGVTTLSGMIPINVAQLVATHKLANGRHEFTVDSPIGNKKSFYIISYLQADYGNNANVSLKVRNIVDDSYITYTGTIRSLYFGELDELSFVSNTVNMFFVTIEGTSVTFFINNVMDNTTTVLIPPAISIEGGQVIWQAVSGATSYLIWDNGTTTTTTNTSYSFNTTAQHQIKVQSQASGYNSEWSNVVTYSPSTETYTIVWNDDMTFEMDDEDEDVQWSVINEIWDGAPFISNGATYNSLTVTEEEVRYGNSMVYEGSGDVRGWNYISRNFKTITLNQDPYKVFVGQWAYFLRYNSNYNSGNLVTLTSVHAECAETDPTSPRIYIKLNGLPTTNTDYDYVLSTDELGDYTGTLAQNATVTANSLTFWAADNDYSSHTEIIINDETTIDFNLGEHQYSSPYTMLVTEDLNLQLNIDYQEP